MTLHEMRKNYAMGAIERASLAADPIEQFQRWFEDLKNTEAPDWYEKNALTLATADPSGVVTSRIVLLKSVDAEGFKFFTNYGSAKAKQMAENPHASMTFYWPMLERQVRVEGNITKTDAGTSDKYFESRPFLSRLGAIASPQSQVIPDDLQLEDHVEKLQSQYADQRVPRPEFWGGYNLKPIRVEFWHGKPSRLHDRFRYRLDGNQWFIERLAP
jgi:pyridoxamine 5'-phosphate oxidase